MRLWPAAASWSKVDWSITAAFAGPRLVVTGRGFEAGVGAAATAPIQVAIYEVAESTAAFECPMDLEPGTLVSNNRPVDSLTFENLRLGSPCVFHGEAASFSYAGSPHSELKLTDAGTATLKWFDFEFGMNLLGGRKCSYRLRKLEGTTKQEEGLLSFSVSGAAMRNPRLSNDTCAPTVTVVASQGKLVEPTVPFVYEAEIRPA